MVFGDGAIVRAALDALLDALGRFAAPTGARGSVLLMSGGLVVLGFLFVAFLFRSAVVGDLAPVANARSARPRAAPPPAPGAPWTAGRGGSFEDGRAALPERVATLDAALDAVRAAGAEARVLRTRADAKVVRLYRCTTCARGAPAQACEYERGLLVGAFERLAGGVVKVYERACRRNGGPFCEFEIQHRAAEE